MNVQAMTRTELEAARDEAAEQLGRIETDAAAIRSEMAARIASVTVDEQRLRTSLGQITTELARREAMDSLVPTITDHALLRFMERVHGIDVAALKDDLMTDALVNAIKSGASAMKTPQGTFVIRGSSVTTFLPVEVKQKQKSSRSMRQEEGDGGE